MSKSSGRKDATSPSKITSPNVQSSSSVTNATFEIKDNATPRWQLWIAPVVLLITYFIAYNKVYDDKINLGGDSIFYYYLAKALASGKGFSDIMSPVALPHNHFPPGYPFIMSLFMRIGFSGIPFFCGLNGVFGYIAIVLMYFFTGKLTGDRRLGFVVAFFLALNPAFLGSSVITMSEVPVTMFIAAAFYLMVNGKQEDGPVLRDMRFWLLLFCVVVAYYVRSSAISLLPAVMCFYLFRKKWLHAGGIAVGFVAAIIPWVIRTKNLGGSSYLKQFVMKNPYRAEMGKATMGDFITRIIENFQRYVSYEIPANFMADLFPEPADGQVTFGYWIGGFVILGLIIYGLVRLARKQPALVVYVICAGGILLIWPQVWVGGRFMVPLLPFILMLALFSCSYLVHKGLVKLKLPWNPLILSVIALLFSIGPLNRMQEAAEEPFAMQYQNYFKAAEWAKANLPADAVIASRKPELFYYYADRYCVGYLHDSDANKLLADLRTKKSRYVIVDQLGFSSTGRYLVPAIQKNPDSFKVLFQTPAPETFLLEYLSK